MRDLQASHDYHQESEEKNQPLSVKKGITSVAFGFQGNEKPILSKTMGHDKGRESFTSTIVSNPRNLTDKGIHFATKKR